MLDSALYTAEYYSVHSAIVHCTQSNVQCTQCIVRCTQCYCAVQFTVKHRVHMENGQNAPKTLSFHVQCNAISYEEGGFCALQLGSIHCNIVQHIAIHLRYEEGYIWFVEIHTIDRRRGWWGTTTTLWYWGTRRGTTTSALG